jgi:hypothetical protein
MGWGVDGAARQDDLFAAELLLLAGNDGFHADAASSHSAFWSWRKR